MGTAELRNSERELQQFQLRIGVAGIAMLIAFGILVARFFFLQVVQHEHYRSKAEDNRISIVPIPPNRGLIIDRNGVVVARNYSGYTLEIFPRRVKSVEATIDELAELIEITPRDRARFKRLTVETRNPESLPIRTRLTDEEVAQFAANRFRYEGVEIKARLFRQYPYGDVGSHVIGYMGRINKDDQAALENEGVDANYRGTDYIGRSGVEGTYERELHGTTGFEQVEIDAAGRGIRTLATTAGAGRQQRRADARHAPAARGRERLRRAPRRAGGDRAGHRRGARASCPSRASTSISSSTASTRRTGPSSTPIPTGRSTTAPSPASIRRARPSSRSWRSPRSRWASARPRARSTTRATSSSATAASATPSPAATASSTCTSRSSCPPTRTTTSSRTTWASTRSPRS